MSFSTITNRTYAHNVCIYKKATILRSNGQELTAEDMEALKAAYPTCIALAENETGLQMLEITDLEHLPEGLTAEEIRAYFATHREEDNYLMARAKGLISWRKSMRYCPRCGAALMDSQSLTARECPECKSLHFPKIEPCIITVIRKGDEILLARHVERNQDIYACIAGFVEDGESLEHAVRREIREEVGLEVKNIRYFGSQSWPFPFQLMVGFTAEYESGEIKVQQEELQEARWFNIHELPNHPRPGSISYELIHSQK